MDWAFIKEIATVIFAVATFVTAGLLGLVYGDQKRLRTAAEDLRKRVDDLESERADDKVKIAERDGKILERDAEIALLKNVVTGKVEWIAVTDQVEEHHRQALQQWTKTDAHLVEIPAAIEKAVTAGVEKVIAAMKEKP